MITINSDTIDSLLQKAYWVVDILPKQVPSGSKGQYFKVEQFFLSHLQMESLYQKFAIIIIKLNCYDDISVCPADNEWIKNPNPSAIIQWLKDCPIEKKDIFVILESSETMITINSEDTHMTIYNPDDDILQLIRRLAAAEGLFTWKPSAE